MWTFHSPSNFFGLKPSDKPLIHEEIFQLIYYGQGFTHNDVYCMPTYLRKFYLKKLVSYKDEEKKQIDKAQKKTSKPMTKFGV